MILILTNGNDPSADLVVPKLLERGLEVYRWDPAGYPASARITSRLTGSSWRHTLVTPDAEIYTAAVGSVWLRRPGEPQAAPTVTDPAYRDVVSPNRADPHDRLAAHPRRPLVPPPVPNSSASLRTSWSTSAAAARIGFTVPPTTVTNDPRELALAWEQANGRFIAKEVELVPYQVDGADHAFYTTSVTRRHLTSRHRLAHAPMILQPRIDKAVELRVTVVGDQVFTAAISSQNSRTTLDDVRHQSALTGYSAYDLPPAVAERCVRLVSSLGLAFGCIDVILTPEGDYVYLELNPAGQWAWVEELTGLPIAAAIADWLAAGEHPTH